MRILKCSNCQEHKDEILFSVCKSIARGRQFECKACQSVRRRAYCANPAAKQKNKEQAREYRKTLKYKQKASAYRKTQYARYQRFVDKLRGKYGLSLYEWAHMLNDQDRICAVCPSTLDGGRDTHVDHCHVTGKIRGLLCRSCNLALGFVRDNPHILQSLTAYLARYR